MLAVPPPVIQSNTVDQLTSGPQQPQATMQTVTTQQPTILQHQTIIPQNMPIHLHQGNMVIQQQVPANQVHANVSIPPPNLHTIPVPVKQTPLHIQGPPLSQPPPNIQLQQPQTTQIVLNQPQSNYQYQYIPNDGSQQQVTIQHIYQPTTQLRPPQSQQYIVQGTTYMVPPPNIIQHQPPPVAQSQTQQPNIIFQTAPPQPGQLLQQIQFQPPPNIVDSSTMNQMVNEDAVKDEKSTPDFSSESPIKTEGPDGDDNGPLDNGQLSQQMQQPPPTVYPTRPPQSQQKLSPHSGSLAGCTSSLVACTSSLGGCTTARMMQPPIMAVPPPMTIVGNTVIATSQAGQTQQIYNPVSIQQIQAPQQQIQHFLVNAQQWQPQQHQFQQISQNGNIQGYQLTTPQQQTIITPQQQGQSQQHILTTAFNPHIPAPTMMQVQLQPLPTQQITIDNHQQLIDQNALHAPPPITYQQIQTVRPATHVVDGQIKMNLPPYPPQVTSPQPVPYPNSVNNFEQMNRKQITQVLRRKSLTHSIRSYFQHHEQQLRPGQKRKRDSSTDDDLGPPHHILPRMGMG